MLVNREQLARLMGVTPSRISQLVSAGMPARKAGRQGQKTEFDAIVCLAWWRSKFKAESANEGLRDEHLKWQIRKLQLDVRQREGELVPAADVDLRNAARTVAARER